jgi:S-adenosylmethionine/arginine decarboxylase-like enzyme
MCGAAQPQRALEVIEQALLPRSHSLRTIERGQL